MTVPAWVPKWLADLAERSGTTFVQVFIGLLIVGQTIDASTAQIAAMGALAAVLAVVKAAALEFLLTRPRRDNVWWDLAERTGATFVESFLAVLIVNPGEIGSLKLAWAAALPAALAVVKGGFATTIGKHGSAAALPARLDPAY